MSDRVIRPIFQNDDRLNTNINLYGCLFRSLSMVAEMAAGYTLSPDQIEEQYRWLIDHGHMKENCWVLNHEAVIESAQYYLGVPQGAAYLERSSRGGTGDFKNPGVPNAFIGHGKTENGYGHFFVVRRDGTVVFDPYWPSPVIVRPLTFRSYFVREARRAA